MSTIKHTIYIYECPVCHKQYADEKSALACEAKHVKPSEIRDRYYFSGSEYPHVVDISFEDGCLARYKLVTAIR